MKKFLLVTFISLITLSTTFAAFTFPGWKCRDLTQINQAIADVQAEQQSNKKEAFIVRLTILKNITEKNITTFEALKLEVETVVNASNMKDKENQVVSIISAICLADDKIFEEAASYIKEHKVYNSMQLPMYWNINKVRILRPTDDESYNFIITYLRKNGIDKYMTPKVSLAIIKRFTYLCTKTSYTTQKEDLTYLNRIFTRKLIENKTQWEPVVVQIRTALETY